MLYKLESALDKEIFKNFYPVLHTQISLKSFHTYNSNNDSTLRNGSTFTDITVVDNDIISDF